MNYHLKVLQSINYIVNQVNRTLLADIQSEYTFVSCIDCSSHWSSYMYYLSAVLCQGSRQICAFFMAQIWYFISKNQPGLRRSGPLKSSPGSHSLLVSDSVGITSSCSLLAFPLLVSLASSCLHCLCFSVSISNFYLW